MRFFGRQHLELFDQQSSMRCDSKKRKAIKTNKELNRILFSVGEPFLLYLLMLNDTIQIHSNFFISSFRFLVFCSFSSVDTARVVCEPSSLATRLVYESLTPVALAQFS